MPHKLVGEDRGHVDGWSRDVLWKKLDTRDHWDRYFVKDRATRRYAGRPEPDRAA